ncbi:hypothetical protein MRB53_018556 [Persea americana]|uniref:Uncharacterized protein n=1 Tax=Persea americana TaxID=3435 RepID=A0ACC2M7T3_PERAE|nr:hypothetical protein MRB53_018556 [Persea americana]
MAMSESKQLSLFFFFFSLFVAFSLAANVTYDSRSLIIDGQRKLLLSASIHYPRSVPANRALAQVTVFFFSGDGGQVAGLRGGDDGTATEQRRRRSCRDGRRVIVCVRIVWFFFRSRRQSAAVASPTMPDGRRRTMAASGDGCDGDPGSNRTPGDGCETRRAAAETDLG